MKFHPIFPLVYRFTVLTLWCNNTLHYLCHYERTFIFFLDIAEEDKRIDYDVSGCNTDYLQ